MIANHKGEVPVVVLILPFLAGITAGIHHPNADTTWLAFSIVMLSIAFIALNLFYNRFGTYKIRWLGGALIMAILLLLGLMVAVRHNELSKPDHFSKKQARYLMAVISSEPKVKNNLTRFTAIIKQSIASGKTERVNGTMLVTIKDDLTKNLFYGQKLLIPARYARVDPPFNPGEFNYRQYLANHNIYHQAYLYPGQYAVIKAGSGNPVIAYALQLRQNLVRKLKANMADTNAVAVASTLILGYRADLSNEVLQAYSKTGTIHILSVSGGHVAIIYLLLNWALGFLNRYKHGRLTRAIIIVLLIWGYSLLTGFSPAVCRAAVMLSFIVVGKTYSRYINTLNILAASAFVLLLNEPYLIRDAGFQLSYLAVAGLIVFQPIVYKWFAFDNRMADKIWMYCSVSIAAQVITFPLSAWYFHQLPVYFLLSNLLIVLPVSIILYTGILLLAMPQLGYVSKTLGYILENCILFMNKALAFIEHAPLASIGKIWLSTFEYLLLYAIVILVFYFLYDKRKWLVKAALWCLLLLSISISYKKIRADNTRSVTFLNLRKHTGIVFKNGSEGIVLSDLTENDKNFLYAIQPCLDSSKITAYKVYDINSDVTSAWMIKQHNLLQFLNKRILLLNHRAQIQSIHQCLKTDCLYLNDDIDPGKDLLAKGNALLIIDVSNSDQHISLLQRMFKHTNVNYRPLKRNKSVTLTSN